MNKIVITGRLTRDPELKVVGSDLKVCNFSVAVDRPHAKEKTADFFDCVAYRAQAEFVAKWFMKGKPILVSGKMVSRKWQDKNGTNRTSWELAAEEIDFFGGEKKQQTDAVIPAEIVELPGGDPFEGADNETGLPF